MLLTGFVVFTAFITTEAVVSTAGDEFHSDRPHENTTIAEQLYNEVRILCLVMTSPEDHQSKAIHVKRTWGSRCNKLIFMSTVEGSIIIFILLISVENSILHENGITYFLEKNEKCCFFNLPIKLVHICSNIFKIEETIDLFFFIRSRIGFSSIASEKWFRK